MIRIVLDIVAELFQRVPEKARGYVYLVLVVGGLIYIAVTAWRSGFTVDQLVALLFSIVGGLANSNRPTVQARTRARQRPDNNQE